MGQNSGSDNRPDTLTAALGRMLAAQKAEKAYQEHLQEFGRKLAYSGLCLIPSPDLRSNQIVVSQEVYDAAKEILNYEGSIEPPPVAPPQPSSKELGIKAYDKAVEEVQDMWNELEYSDE